MESYDNYSGHRKMSILERFPLFGEYVIRGSTVCACVRMCVCVRVPAIHTCNHSQL